MDQVADVGRALPSAVLWPCLLVFALVIAGVIRRTPSGATRFVLIAVSARIALAALHEITYDPSPLGLSWNALASVAVFAAGLLVVRRRSPADPALIPFYPILLVMIASGCLNGQVAPLATAMTKFLYLLVLVLAAADGIADVGPKRFFRLMLWPFTLPVVLQVFSLLLGYSKPGEDGGAASYIGGFYHEAGFSLVLASGLLVTCLLGRVRMRVWAPLAMVFVLGIVLANYRTAVLGMLPVLGCTLLLIGSRRFVPEQRGLAVGMLLILAVAVVTAGAIKEQDRFGDLGALTQGTGLIKPPEDFTVEERRILSGRPAIWSGYILAWRDAPAEQKLIGFGPESWGARFRLYAHNTLVSDLYEIGVIGVAAMLFLWGWMTALAVMVKGDQRIVLAAGHVSFFVLNMATMPMWMIEGMIFYGLLCGYTVACFRSGAKAAAKALTSGQTNRRFAPRITAR